MARVVKQPHRSGLETLSVLGQGDVEPLAVRRGLLVREWQPAECVRQAERGIPLALTAGARNQVVGTYLSRPQPDLDWLGDPAPHMRVRRNQHLGVPPT